jgi:hypothetical protein
LYPTAICDNLIAVEEQPTEPTAYILLLGKRHLQTGTADQMTFRTFFAYDPRDTEEIRLEKFAIFLVASSCTLAGIIWTVMYYILFGWGLITFLPLGFVIFVGAALVVSHMTKNHQIAVYTQIVFIMYITAFIQWNIGDVFASGFVLAWAICGPIVALIFFSFRRSMVWFALYLLNLVITVLFNDFFASRGELVEANTRLFLFFMNLSFSSLVVFIFAGYYVTYLLPTSLRS